ncbi:MAG: S-layer protein, partial [archaeon]
MKKIVAGAAALGVSALLAGSVVAANVNGDDFGSFNELTKDQLFTSGVPAYNIVVGSMGQTIDVVWAGNIAAAIGKMAYTTAGTVGGAALQDVTIEVGSSSTSTISGDG